MGISLFGSRVPTALPAALLLLVCAAAGASAQTVTASWDRNADSYTAGYRLYYGTASGSYQWSIDAGNQTSAPVNLSAGSLYYFAVRAYNAQYDYGPPSNEATIDLRTAAAAAPTAQISATLDANNAATVTWQTTNATSATINGTAVGPTGTATVTVASQTTFTLVARSAAGQTATASATVTPSSASSAPTAQITATLGSNDVATVTWQTTNATSASINGYGVAASGSANVTVTGQTTFTLEARNAAGQTATASATVTPGSSVPGAPTDMSASVSSTEVTVSWRPPTTGPTASSYVIDVGTAPGASDIARSYDIGNVLSISKSLPVGTYYARIRAANAFGMSAFSNEAQFSVGTRLQTPGSLGLSWEGTMATVSWAAPAADGPDQVATSYTIEAGTSPGASDVGSVEIGNITSVRADVPSGTYYVRVRARNSVGVSDPTGELVVSAPGTPQAPSALVSIGDSGQVELRWQAPAGGSAPSGYVIEAGSRPGVTDLARLNVGNVTSFTTTAPPGIYYVRVLAVNDRGTSVASNEVVVQR